MSRKYIQHDPTKQNRSTKDRSDEKPYTEILLERLYTARNNFNCAAMRGDTYAEEQHKNTILELEHLIAADAR